MNTGHAEDHMPDRLLVAGLKDGEEQAFAELYKRLHQRVYWYAKKYVQQSADAQDLTAETFVQLWKHRTEFKDLNSVSAFLHITVRNKCYDLLRREQMKNNHHNQLLQLLKEDEPGDFYLEQIRIELMRKIYTEVDKLPARMKQIFLLSYHEGLKPAQIAERLQLKVQTVTNQRVSAIHILRQALNREPLLLAVLLLLEQECLFA